MRCVLMHCWVAGSHSPTFNNPIVGSKEKIAEMIELEFEKKTKELKRRETDMLNLAQKIEEYGRVIVKK